MKNINILFLIFGLILFSSMAISAQPEWKKEAQRQKEIRKKEKERERETRKKEKEARKEKRAISARERTKAYEARRIEKAEKNSHSKKSVLERGGRKIEKTSRKSETTTKSSDVYRGPIVAEPLIKEARKYLGTRYKYGGESPKRGFDCSGYTQYVFNKMGYKLPRTSNQQSKAGKRVSTRSVQPGDLIFFGKRSSKITHVGIVISQKGEPLKMIHASSSEGISITNVNQSNYWKKRLKKARRYL